MNLIIEQGNSSSKVAVYQGGVMIEHLLCKNLSTEDIALLFEKYDIKHGILSTVINVNESLVSYLKSRLRTFIILDEFVPLPIKVEYKSPSTLGKDRLSAVVGANYLEPGQDLLVIDAGTAITYDLIKSSGVYIGGNISPGMTTRFKALNQFTSKLPLVEQPDEVQTLGYNTLTAIQSGVVKGIIYEMDGCIEELKSMYPSLLVFLTGGHSNYFERRLKNSIFADINLVLTGLNRILDYNVEN